MKLRLLRLATVLVLAAAPLALTACGGYVCDDAAGDTSTAVLADDECGEDD
jgi:hypothetical protein